MKIVVTIVGQDRVGIVAKVASVLAAQNVNILDINQNIIHGFFNMVMIADTEAASLPLQELQVLLKKTGEELGVEIKAQSEDIFNLVTRV